MTHGGLCCSWCHPAACSTACRTCAASDERPPSGPVHPACRSSTCRQLLPGEQSSGDKSRSRIRTSPAGTVNRGISAGSRVSGRQDSPAAPVASLWLRFPRSGVSSRIERRRRSAASCKALALSASHPRRSAARSARKGIVEPWRFFSSAAFKHQVGHGGVKHHLSHGDRSQLAFAKAGKHQRLVDQGPLLPEPFQPAAASSGPQLPDRFAFSLALGERSCVQQRPATGHVQERRSSASVNARRCGEGRPWRRPFDTPANGLPNRRRVANAPIGEGHAGFASKRFE